MFKCPHCEKELGNPQKSWIYGIFKVDKYSCECGARFNEYTSFHVVFEENSMGKSKLEKHSFVLEQKKGSSRFEKVKNSELHS